MIKAPFTAAVGIESAVQLDELEIKTDFDRNVGEVAVGLLMSEKTGLVGIPNRHGPLYPTFEEASRIINKAASLQPPFPVIIHYNTDHHGLVGPQLIRALAPYPYVDGVQINGLRVEDIGKLACFREKYPEVSIVVQINEILLNQYGPEELAGLLAGFTDAIDYAWLDGSGGNGLLMDTRFLMPFIESLREQNIRVGVAGGLNAENIEDLLYDLIQRYPDLSCDAQSGVQSRIGGHKRFDTKKAREFLARSLQLRGAL